jgi:D-alanyl-D-alanine carboxypeptidase
MSMSRRIFPLERRPIHRSHLLLVCLLLVIGHAAVVPAAQAEPASRPIHQASQLSFSPQLETALNRALDQTIAGRYIPGVAVAVTLPGGQTWQGGSGLAQLQPRVAMNPAFNFGIASVTKLFVATVVLQLVEQERLALDAPINRWLPDVAPSASTITVRQLLSHTSGLYDYLDGPFLRGVQRDPQRRWSPKELVAYALQHRSSFTPGARGRWQYSNTNYVLLGMLVERVTQRTLAQEIRQRILNPVGLTQTFFAPDEAARGRRVHGYAGGKDLTNLNLSYAWASGNLVSTVDDLGQFMRALANGRLLGRATLAQMYRWIDTRGALGLPNLQYGLGIMRLQLPVGRDAQGRPRAAGVGEVIGHIGNLGGYRTAVWYLPASGMTIAVGLNQGGASPVPVSTRVLEAILAYQDQQAVPEGGVTMAAR